MEIMKDQSLKPVHTVHTDRGTVSALRGKTCRIITAAFTKIRLAVEIPPSD